mmetsp:Transcript_21207/g.63291  ORF Transcript_21207/g.63291 Transcript_21207/m.63291 type:complete len:227 (-) Transcript_21207:30-710(-)
MSRFTALIAALTFLPRATTFSPLAANPVSRAVSSPRRPPAAAHAPVTRRPATCASRPRASRLYSATPDSVFFEGLRARAEELRRAEAVESRLEKEIRRPGHAYVVLFRGDESGDGIHSLSSEGREIVLAFEAVEEARRFALVLQAQGFYEPTPQRMAFSALEDFCESDERISLLRVPSGTCIVPPDERVDAVEFTPTAPQEAAQDDRELADEALKAAKARLELLFQ